MKNKQNKLIIAIMTRRPSYEYLFLLLLFFHVLFMDFN